mgnify:FL=1
MQASILSAPAATAARAVLKSRAPARRGRRATMTTRAAAAVPPPPGSENWSESTRAVHNGERGGRPRVSDSLTTPVCMTSTYWFQDSSELIDYQEGNYGSFEYGRYGNPTTKACEEKIRLLEEGEDCFLSASGMNSAICMLLALVPANGHIVTTTDCYRRTRQFVQTFMPKMGVSCTVLDPSDYDGLEKALNEHDCSLYFSESPTNPYLRCVDIERIAKLCKPKGCLVCIDGTFATPVNLKPLKHGADLVIHSASKYFGGHNDVLAGAIVGDKETVAKVRQFHNILGGVLDPHAAYLVMRGVKTLQLRVERHNDNAMKLATRLESHPMIETVHYPGLPSHPDHEVAKKYMKGFGGVVSFEVKGDLWATAKFIDNCKLPYIAPSLGGVESLIEQPTVVSYWDQGAEKRAEIGIKDNLVRMSCGIEDYEDIEADIIQALDSIQDVVVTEEAVRAGAAA